MAMSTNSVRRCGMEWTGEITKEEHATGEEIEAGDGDVSLRKRI